MKKIDNEDWASVPDLVDLNAYSDWVLKMWNYDGIAPQELTLSDDYIMSTGLGGETGEVLEILKKYEKGKKHNLKLDKTHLKEELGDVLYYLTMISVRYDITLGDIIEFNINKLEKRAEKNKKVIKKKKKAKKRTK